MRKVFDARGFGEWDAGKPEVTHHQLYVTFSMSFREIEERRFSRRFRWSFQLLGRKYFSEDVPKGNGGAGGW
jgi:hypothetical protein